MRIFFILTLGFLSLQAEPLYRLKGQNYFYRNFERMDADRWLDTDIWKKSLKHTPIEKRAEIERKYREEFAHVITCVGSCRVHRDSGHYSLSYKSVLVEGDSVETGKNSILWLALKDGNLLRLSSLTKVKLSEINLGSGMAQVTISLTHGFIHGFDRRDDPMIIGDGLIDTDPMIFPLRFEKANMEYYYWKKHHKKGNLRGSTRGELFQYYLSGKAQVEQVLPRDFKRKYLIHSSYGDMIVENASFMMAFDPAKGSYWWHGLNEGELIPATVQLRKETAFEETLYPRKWHLIKDGLVEVKPELGKLFSGESYIMQRGVGVRVVRDRFFLKYSQGLYKSLLKKNRHTMAREGARLWSLEELNQREAYLKKYYHFMGRTWMSHYNGLKKKWPELKVSYYNGQALKVLISELQSLKILDSPILRKLGRDQLHFYLWAKAKGRWYPVSVDKGK